ncbi:MAG: hypothetical protein HRU14_18225 [Planctomycetes bacterium]|nr:hypothetical protein [Planctomycetota bacterium]
MDPLLDYVVNQGGGVAGPIFFGFVGTLDAAGQSSSPAIIIPNVPALSGQTVWFAFSTGLTGAPNGVNTISHNASVTLQ